jgi:hypothetical protein
MLGAVGSRHPALAGALEFLYPHAAGRFGTQGLRVEPSVAAHRNLIGPDAFVLPRERFGGTEDVGMVPLIREVVDETLRAHAATSPHLLEYVGTTPISPYGSMGLSVSRWGQVDWDYVRDLDWRIFLPPEIGHRSGFKTLLEQTLTAELHKSRLYPVSGGKDAQGQAQVQLRDAQNGVVHGFHFFLLAMKPGFVRGNIHKDGGYSPHFAFFPEGSMDAPLEAANLVWPDLIAQMREDYVEMFNQLSFNIFGENSGEDRLLKTRGWYLHKAFKWYASLARLRGLEGIEEDLLYQYEHFRGSEAELSYLARYRYYARMSPSPQHLDDVDRDLARAASIAYARARNAGDALVGKTINVDGDDVILLETVAEDYAAAARKLLEGAGAELPEIGMRFGDNLGASCVAELDGAGRVALIPAEWSMVFCDAYVAQVVKRTAEEGRGIGEAEIRQGLAALLGCLLWAAGV